jgi:hypothetical protein
MNFGLRIADLMSIKPKIRNWNKPQVPQKMEDWKDGRFEEMEHSHPFFHPSILPKLLAIHAVQANL